jgi:hypothetical protein
MENQKSTSKSVRITVSDLLMNYSAISLFIGISLILSAIICPYFGKGYFVIDKYNIDNLTSKKIEQLKLPRLDSLGDKYLNIYQNRKEHYMKSSNALSTIVNSLGICCLISILALYYETRDSIYIAGVELPFKAVFLILPILMLYLWLSFGFTYFSALDSRNSCFVAAVKYERIIDLKDSIGYEENDVNIPDSTLKINYHFSIIHNLEDMGIVDGSVHIFNGLYSEDVYNDFYYNREDKYKESNESQNIAVPIPKREPLFWVVGMNLYLIFGTLLGISMGFIVTLLIRFRHLKTTDSIYSKYLVLIVFVMLCLSFAGFIMAKQYFLPFLGYMWIIAGIVIYIYVVRLRNRPELDI